MSTSLHRINIDEWRSSVHNPQDLTTVQPPSQGGRFPAHARPLPPPNPSDFPLHLQPTKIPTTTSLRPCLTLLTASASDEEVESRSGSEVVSERSSKKEEADRLVDSTLDLLLSVWPSPPTSFSILTPPASAASSDSGCESDQDAVPLRTFVNEILRRSRSSCATLRAARLYLERAATLLPPGQERKSTLACPRRTFLSALILANKFLHDRVYSNRAWGKVSGLQVREISQGEAALGDLLGWALWVGREPGTYNPALDAELEANAPPLVAIGDAISTRSLAAGIKRGRSSSSANVLGGRSQSSDPHSILASHTSTFSRTASVPIIVLNGGLDSVFTSPESNVHHQLPVAPLPRLRSAFTTASIFGELSSLATASSIIEEETASMCEGGGHESSSEESSSEVGTVEDEQQERYLSSGQHHGQKRQRLDVKVVEEDTEEEQEQVGGVSQLEMEVAWSLGLGVAMEQHHHLNQVMMNRFELVV